MKKCFKPFAKVPGFIEHVRQRPSGFNRYDWGLKWLIANGVDLQAIPPPKKVKAWKGRPTLGKAVVRHDTGVNSVAFLQSYEWRSLRMRVLKKFGAICQCCGASAKHGVRIHVDHIKPRREFPELALVESNLQVLCEECNHGKGNWDQTDWRPEGEKPAPAIPEDWNRPMWSKPGTVN